MKFHRVGSILIVAVISWTFSGAALAADSECPQTADRPSLSTSRDLSIARDLALSRLRSGEPCRALFEAEGADGIAVLNGASFRRATDTEHSEICRRRNAALFTTMHGSEIVICSREYREQGLGRRAALLIHEALHHAGVGERPVAPDSMSSAQLTRLVERRCGL